MNQDQALGRWAQLKGSAKKAWGRLTGNDNTLIEGVLEAHHGEIQKKTGDNAEAREARLGQLPAEVVRDAANPQ